MGGWYRVVKTIKGHRYLYEQQTYREGGHVRTLNRYIGRADGVESSSSSRVSQTAHTRTPLFRGGGDFGRATLTQFDAPKWVEDTGQQLLGDNSQRARSAPRPARRRRKAEQGGGSRVTTTRAEGRAGK